MTKSWNHREETLNGRPEKWEQKKKSVWGWGGMHAFKTRNWPKLMRTYIDHMCYMPAHSIAFICRVITLMEDENTSQSKQRYRPGVGELGSKPWPWRLSGPSTGGEDEEEDDQQPSEPFSSLPINPELGIIFSRSTSEPTLPSPALTHKHVTSHTLGS